MTALVDSFCLELAGPRLSQTAPKQAEQLWVVCAGYSPSSVSPGCSSGRRPSGQWNLRSDSLMDMSLMQA